MKKIKIGNRMIGEREPVFIIAEAGVNHNGSLRLAKKLIDVAKDAGADAVKFQTFKAENIVTKNAPKAKYQRKNTDRKESQYEMLQRLELSYEDFKKLSNYCNKKKIIFLSTPYDKESVDFLVKLGVSAIKIGSGEITNIPFLEYIAKKKLPIILSTGMSNLEEVREAVEAIYSSGNNKLILLHCVSNYPAKIEDVNLKAMDTLKKEFNVPVGYSDHTKGIDIAIAAIAKGAYVIEKHFTVDKSLAGPDHLASLDRKELPVFIKTIRKVEKALGTGVKIPAKEEMSTRLVLRRSIVARKNIRKGQILKLKDITCKRPGKGISPVSYERVIGREALRDISKDEIIQWKMLKRRDQ